VQEHGGGQMIPFSCVLEKNLSDMPPDEAAKYCEANNVQRSEFNVFALLLLTL
ncbi:obg-like ATPase, partial [Trifolium medium]|nr:obg-like ATPase [Trifolium medium]